MEAFSQGAKRDVYEMKTAKLTTKNTSKYT